MSRAIANPAPDRATAALFADPALAEALADPDGFDRLSDADVHALVSANRARRRLALGSATAALLVMFAGGWWAMTSRLQPGVIEHYATARGQNSEIRLADGSTVTLSGATSVDVTLAPDHRAVMLRAGEAYFDVAHDPARPFTVRAGASSARVLGTAFDLDLTGGRVQLDVYRGAVRFGNAQPGAAGTVVRAGWRSRFVNGVAGMASQFDPGGKGWRQGWLDTDDMPLSDVVEAINRQGGTLVLPPPASLDSIRVAGRFKLDDPATLLGALGDAYGFRVRREGDRLHLEPGGNP